MTYKYEKPKGIHGKIPVKRWNNLYYNGFRRYFVNIDAYLSADSVRVEFTKNLFSKIIFGVISPIVLVFGILDCGLSETIEDFKDVFFDKARGKFVTEVFFMKHDLDKFNEVVQMMEIKWYK